MSTELKKSISRELQSKLLLEDASGVQIARHLHRKHSVQLLECALAASVIGFVLRGIL